MYKSILVPLDGSATADSGLHEAIGLASALEAKLILLHVLDDLSMVLETSSVAGYERILDRMRCRGQEILNKARMTAVEAGVEAETCLREVSLARIAGVVVDEAIVQSCDLIVMGTHGRHGFSRLTMGSNAESVVRSSPVPALLVRHEAAAWVPAPASQGRPYDLPQLAR